MMENLLSIFIGRSIIRTIGQYTRYWFFRMLGKKRSFKSFAPVSRDEYKDLGRVMTQDFWNAAVGMVIFILLCLTGVAIAFG